MSEKKTYAEAVDEIRSRLDIYEVVQSYVMLKKRGQNYWGCCPFHNEKTPSFSVNVQKGIFKCFGCGEGGDAFSFLMKIKNQTFGEVVKDLAEQFNIELPQTSGNTQKYKEEKQLLKDFLKKCGDYYHENLINNKDALSYLEKRGITREIIDEYKLGFSEKSYDSLQKKFKADYTPQLMEKAGMLVKTEKGDLIDRFRNRIMIPIRDEAGDIIAFGARATQKEQTPKYLNSPDTVLYNKSRILYGINVAKNEMIKEDYVVIMEGYFDVISAQAAGLKNAVASCGTALTVDHVKLIGKYSKSRKIYLAFDTDAAGLKATQRSTDVIKEAFTGLGDIKMFDQTYASLDENKYTCEIRVIAPLDSKDPDEYIREYGIDNYKEYIKKAPLLLDFRLEQILKEYKQGISPTEKLALVKKILPLIEEIPNGIVQNEYVRLVAGRIDTDETTLMKEINKTKRLNTGINKAVMPIVTKSSNIEEKAQKNLLSLFLTGGSNSDMEYLLEIIKNVKFSNKNLNFIKEAIDKSECKINNDVDKLIQTLYVQFADDSSIKETITDLIYIAESFKNLDSRTFREAVNENAKRIIDYRSECESKELVSKYKKLSDDDIEALEYQKQLREQINNKRKIGD